ncbi:hypothetical protein NDU88_009654 [Pleurodeles waltl]|uniref:Uncharacterized protein n=1 Tax=Pleurodeles waltl TaxID=8319 RepID=A0AAV7QY62_PLEWA|nr:hypothetical protein NDU88_009654 [Pleurodeles waltl]
MGPGAAVTHQRPLGLGGRGVGRSPQPVFALRGTPWCLSGRRIRPSLGAARAPLRTGVALSPLLSAGARASPSRSR